MQGGADAAVTSIHKTLGGMSGTALLNVGKNSRLDPSRVKQQHMMMAVGNGDAVSPFILADLEGCIESFSKDGESLISNALRNAQTIKDALGKLQKVKIADFAETYPDIKLIDPLKMTFKVEGYTGAQLWDVLESKFKIRNFLALLAIKASRCCGTNKCGRTLENHDPGPITIQSASVIAAMDSMRADGFSGCNRRDSNRPLAVATWTCPLTINRPVELVNVASISSGS